MSGGTIEAGLSTQAHNIHQALASLQEELEAIDYYHQRVDVTSDEFLKGVLAHNRDDEMEHAMMLLEWLRRELPSLDGQMRKFLFTTGSILPSPGEGKPPSGEGAGLGLGGLK